MTRKEVAATLIALFALAGCVTLRPNPERRTCSAQCVEVKNSCMVAAGSAEAVAGWSNDPAWPRAWPCRAT
jgi:hypothetical protein